MDELRAAALYQWPGPVHLGNGKMQLIIDERADARQRAALVKIMSGEETNEMATMWWVYSAMCATKLPPLFAPIRLEIDVDARKGQLVVPGVVEASGQPIRNPVTGAEHRARIDLPHGFEYRIAEIGSGRTKASGKIDLDLTDTYAQFANIHLIDSDVVEEAVAQHWARRRRAWVSMHLRVRSFEPESDGLAVRSCLGQPRQPATLIAAY